MSQDTRRLADSYIESLSFYVSMRLVWSEACSQRVVGVRL